LAGERVITTAYVFLTIGIAFFVLLLIRSAIRIFGKYEAKTKFKSKFGGFVDFMLLSIGIILVLGSQIFFWLSSNLKYHTTISGKSELGAIKTFSNDDIFPKLGFRYTPVLADGPNQAFSFELEGFKWYVTGELVKWPKWTSILGLKTSCKINRICSDEHQKETSGIAGRDYYDIGGGKSEFNRVYDNFKDLLLGMQVEMLESESRMFAPGHDFKVFADSNTLIVEE